MASGTVFDLILTSQRMISTAKSSGGGGRSSKKSVGKFQVPEGYYSEKPYQKIANERGRDACGVCCSTCCAATRHLINDLIDIEEVRTDIKVLEDIIIIRIYVILVPGLHRCNPEVYPPD